MKRMLRTTLILGVAVFSLKGCIFSPGVTPPPDPGPGSYKSPTAPESLVANLQESYRRQEIEEYAKLLAPEFIYKFQTVDYDEVPKGFWTHDEDSVGTRSLFQASVVQEIRIELIGLDPEPSNEIDHPAGAVKIRIVSTHLEVDQSDGITWVAEDQQDMFFRKGNVDAGEDSTHWFIFEWRDLESGTGSAPSLMPSSTQETRPLIVQKSWGSLMQEALKLD